MTDKTGGAAFPQYKWSDAAERFMAYGGMTLRDYFAAKALPGVIEDGTASTVAQLAAELGVAPDTWNPTHWKRWCAKEAYEYADAMLAQREKEAG